jgi:hypothetical protein
MEMSLAINPFINAVADLRYITGRKGYHLRSSKTQDMYLFRQIMRRFVRICFVYIAHYKMIIELVFGVEKAQRSG